MTVKTFDIKLNDTITGLTNTSWDPNEVVSGRAATEDQLMAAINDNWTGIKGSQGNGNIEVTQHDDGHTWYVNTGDNIDDLTNVTWNPASITSGRAATEDQLSKATEQLPLIVAGGSSAETEVLPNSRKNFQFDLGNLPTNYVIGAYRQISIAGLNFQNVFIQTFSTTGGGRKANISVFNTGSASAQVTISVSTICIRQIT